MEIVIGKRAGGEAAFGFFVLSIHNR